MDNPDSEAVLTTMIAEIISDSYYRIEKLALRSRSLSSVPEPIQGPKKGILCVLEERRRLAWSFEREVAPDPE
jgi:hypothetical protein